MTKVAGNDAFGFAYIALVAVIVGYAVGRSHGEREQKDRKRDSDLFSLKSQVGWLSEAVRRDQVKEGAPA